MPLFAALKWAVLLLCSAAAVFTLVRLIGRKINGKTPENGINESLYADINGTKQWISIYGENRNNPVLLYLHGGPGTSTSRYDYAFTRKWADVYTVVTWDQRNCGKSYSAAQNGTAITAELMISDGLEITKFILRYLKKEKLTLLGHSWGTYLGSCLVYSHPELYDCYIGAGQLADSMQNEETFRKEAAKWTENDGKGKKLAAKLNADFFSEEYLSARNALMKKYGYDMFADGTDYSMAGAHLFNPYYSLGDFYRCIKADFSVYARFIQSDEFRKLSLLDKTEYHVPFYLVLGDKDYQTNYRLARDYFSAVTAPRKKLCMIQDTTHGLLESKSEEFSKIVHSIAREEASCRQ